MFQKMRITHRQHCWPSVRIAAAGLSLLLFPCLAAAQIQGFQIEEAIKRREAGEPLTEIGRSYNVSHQTIGRL